MRALWFQELQDAVAAVSTPEHTLEIFGNWTRQSPEESVLLESQSTDLIREEIDVFFASVEGGTSNSTTISAILNRGLKNLAAYRVEKELETQRFIVGQHKKRSVWIGIKYRFKTMSTWKH